MSDLIRHVYRNMTYDEVGKYGELMLHLMSLPTREEKQKQVREDIYRILLCMDKNHLGGLECNVSRYEKLKILTRGFFRRIKQKITCLCHLKKPRKYMNVRSFSFNYDSEPVKLFDDIICSECKTCGALRFHGHGGYTLNYVNVYVDVILDVAKKSGMSLNTLHYIFTSYLGKYLEDGTCAMSGIVDGFVSPRQKLEMERSLELEEMSAYWSKKLGTNRE